MSINYEKLGVSSSKKEVHAALNQLKDTSLSKTTFCKLQHDPFDAHSSYYWLSHADGVGTKTALAYIYWRETRDVSVWEGIAEDALVMNTDDLLCVGATEEPVLFTSTIARNKKLIPQEVLSALYKGTEQYIEKLRSWGYRAHFCGGETADTGDLARTILVDATATTRLSRAHLIDTVNICSGDVVLGLASDGEASYEQTYNSGIGSNGLTAARHLLLSKTYARKYPESFDAEHLKHEAYHGAYHIHDQLPNTSLTVGEALLSPTRSYIPVIKEVFQKIDRQKIHGIIHRTGGGEKKIFTYREDLKIVREDFPLPPLFTLLLETKHMPEEELRAVFNMGIRLEIYTDEKTAQTIANIAKKYRIDAHIIGRVLLSSATI